MTRIEILTGNYNEDLQESVNDFSRNHRVTNIAIRPGNHNNTSPTAAITWEEGIKNTKLQDQLTTYVNAAARGHAIDSDNYDEDQEMTRWNPIKRQSETLNKTEWKQYLEQQNEAEKAIERLQDATDGYGPAVIWDLKKVRYFVEYEKAIRFEAGKEEAEERALAIEIRDATWELEYEMRKAIRRGLETI